MNNSAFVVETSKVISSTVKETSTVTERDLLENAAYFNNLVATRENERERCEILEKFMHTELILHVILFGFPPYPTPYYAESAEKRIRVCIKRNAIGSQSCSIMIQKRTTATNNKQWENLGGMNISSITHVALEKNVREGFDLRIYFSCEKEA